jgi:beta-adrenergic-receptor kinase
MEELQDAIEDAQYVNAISTQEDGPRPVLAWEIPNEEQLAAWKTKMKTQDPTSFSLEWTLSSALGMFLFSAFLKEVCNDYLRINFCEEVIRWKRLRGRLRIEKAKRMFDTYLKRQESSTHPPTKTEIDEYDLERQPIRLSDIHELATEGYDASSEICWVGLKGPLLQELYSKIEEVEKARADYSIEKEEKSESAVPLEEPTEVPTDERNGEREKEEDNAADTEQAKDDALSDLLATDEETFESSTTSRQSSHFRIFAQKPDIGPLNLPDDFFDKAEAVVMESLRVEYWEAFLTSGQYEKLMNFLWYQDRPVIPEDFFVMRVLGRGGFGLVTGGLTLFDLFILSLT